MNSAKQAQARNQQLIKSRNGTERLTGKQSNQSNLNQIQNQTELLALRKVFQLKTTNVKDPELLNKLKESRFKWELELQAFIKKDLNQNLADYNIRNKNLFKTYLSKINYFHPNFGSQTSMESLS